MGTLIGKGRSGNSSRSDLDRAKEIVGYFSRNFGRVAELAESGEFKFNGVSDGTAKLDADDIEALRNVCRDIATRFAQVLTAPMPGAEEPPAEQPQEPAAEQPAEEPVKGKREKPAA